MKRGGIVGLGIGAVAGSGYLLYNLFEKKKKMASEKKARSAKLRRIDNIDETHPGIDGDKKIVI